MYPLKLKPIYDKTIWANDQLTKIRGVKESGYGTCWEISAHSYCSNKILNGEFAGQTLMELISSHEKEMLGKHSISEMLRVAYLDAKEDLSIQVHPYNEYAIKHDNDMGKTESWYVLDAKPGATLVAGTLCNDKQTIRKAIEDGNLEQYLNKVPIETGDFIMIDAGMLHALGGGIFAIEVGTNSNTTYRFYDYNRKDANGNSRELHIDKSFDVVDLSKKAEKISNPIKDVKVNERKVLTDCDAFVVELYDIADVLELDTKGERFYTLSFVHNDAVIEYQNEEISVTYTENIFIPADCGKFSIKGNARVLVSYVK
ncbi:type I phosphomannose isomerase catalytic subunit [Erysipelotrichaceae bacterium HCN-30851]